MANSFLTNQEITFTALRILKNSLKGVPNIARKYEKYFGDKKHQVGQTISIRLPNRFTTRLGQAVATQPIVDQFVPLTLNVQRGSDVEWSSIEEAADIETLDRILEPQIAQLANDIDWDFLQFAKNTVANQVGTPGTPANTNLIYLQAGQKLDEAAAPQDDRFMIINPAQRVAIVNSSITQFNPTKEISRQYTKGMIGNALGFDWAQDQNVATHVVGSYSGTPVVNGASQMGTSLVTSGWTAGATLNQGDVFTLAGVYNVNPQNRTSTGSLRQFVVQATVTASGGGALTIPIWPAIVPNGAYQTVSASPANAAALTVSGTSGISTPQAIGFHEDAFAAGFLDLRVPGGVDAGYMHRDKETQISMRFVRAYDVRNDQLISRFDVVYGFAGTYPDLAVRVAS